MMKEVASLRLCRALLLLGLAASGLSMFETLKFTWDPLFEAPALPLGPRHPNYHAFREFTLSVGVAAVLLWVMFRPVGKRGRDLWVAMSLAALGYYVGWWLPWPLFGLHAQWDRPRGSRRRYRPDPGGDRPGLAALSRPLKGAAQRLRDG